MDEAAEDERERTADAERADAERPVRKKKKKKRAREAERPAAADSGEAKGADAPQPLPGSGTPEGDTLREAFRAFEVGDHALVRARVNDLAGASDPAVRAAAEDLRRRVAVDPIQVVVVLACAAVLASIVYVWVL